MCFSTPKAPNTGEEMRRAEDEKQAKIRATSAEINSTFDNSFGPDYYGKVGSSFRDYYKPKVDEQFKGARRATTLRFANNANSSAANRSTANLQSAYSGAQQDVESGAFDATNNARKEVEAKRSSLLGMADAGASGETIAAQTRSALQGGLGQPKFSPVGDVFASYMNGLSTTADRSDQGYSTSPFYQRTVDFLRSGGPGSSRVVGG